MTKTATIYPRKVCMVGAKLACEEATCEGVDGRDERPRFDKAAQLFHKLGEGCTPDHGYMLSKQKNLHSVND